MALTTKEMQAQAEQFFADAFCGKKATLLRDKDNFKIQAARYAERLQSFIDELKLYSA